MNVNYHQKATKILNRIIPKSEFDRVLKEYPEVVCDLDPSFLGFSGYYYALSKLIPLDWTVIDFGCGYNTQCYFFTKHKQLISIDIDYSVDDDIKILKKTQFSPFRTPNCVYHNKGALHFIQNNMSSIDLEKTFAICSFVNGDVSELVRTNFKNVFTFYPKR